MPATDQTGPHHRYAMFVLLGLCVLGTLLRLPGLATDLWLDEIWSLDTAFTARSWLEVLRAKIENNHHLISLYEYAIGPGASATSYRLLAFVFGVATVPASWLVGSRDSRTCAIVTSLLFASSAFIAFYASESRGYASVICLVLLAWYCLQRYVADPRTRWIAAFTIACALGLMAHQTFILFFGGAYLWCDLHLQRTVKLRQATKLTWRLFVPPAVFIGLFAVVALVGQASGGPPYSAPVVVAQALAVISGGPQHGAALWLVAAIVVAVIAAAVWSAYSHGDDRWVLYVAGGVIIPTVFVIIRHPETLVPRYFIVPSTILMLAAAHWLAMLVDSRGAPRALAMTLIAMHVVGSTLFLLSDRSSRGQYQAALHHMVAASESDVTVASANGSAASDDRFQRVLNYYGRTLGVANRFEYVTFDDYAKKGAEWLLDEEVDDSPRPPVIIDRQGRRFRLDRAYPTGELSGLNWYLYRRQE